LQTLTVFTGGNLMPNSLGSARPHASQCLDMKFKLTNGLCNVKVDVWCPGTVASQWRRSDAYRPAPSGQCLCNVAVITIKLMMRNAEHVRLVLCNTKPTTLQTQHNYNHVLSG